MIAAALGFIFLAGLFLGVPVVAGLAIVSLAGIALVGDVPLIVTAQTIVNRMNSFILLAIPLFVLTGALMNASGISRRLFDLAGAAVGHLVGGLAQVNVLASVLMGGLSGSSSADAALTTKILVPAMVKRGYDPSFSGAVTAVSATIAPVIPPSIAMIIYASIANVSIGSLFIAGIIPGMMMGLALAITVYVISRRRGYGREHSRESFRTVLKRFADASLALLLPIVIIGGIRLGIFTATEAGAVAALYAFVIGVFVYRELPLSSVPRILHRAAIDTGVIMLIVGVSAPFAWFLVVEQIPQNLASAIAGISDDPLVFLLLVNLFLLVVGAFIEATAMLILVTPILAPIALAMGIDPIHFGIVVIINLMIGNVSPPFGQLVFIVGALGNLSAERVFLQVIRFLPAMLAVLALITYAPELYMWLVRGLGP